MFEHSVKVPRNYKIAANILKKVSTEGGSVKTLLYENKLRHFNTNRLFALITKTIQHAAELDKVFELCNVFKTESRLDPWLAKILATELLFGKKSLPGQSKPEQTIISFKEQFEKYTSDQQDEKTQVRRPRYVRINTNLLTTSDAIRAFQDEGYRFIRCTSGSYDDYLKQIQELTEYDFTQDYHIKYLFVFAPGTRLHEHELYLENKIVLQDKATAMAVHVLAAPPGSVALDMCAAPGMKTTQLAASMRNQGKIYAVERNEQRYQTLCDFVEKTGAKCVETLHKDALELKRGEYDDVEYIILDPSCSGSGMELSVHNYIEDTRLAKLTSLQEKFLKHAMNAFPKAKRIIYSTCSLFPEENERVITNVVKFSRAKWRVQDVKELLKGQWNNFGSGMYGSMGARCMYARPESDLTIGFFLAVLDRDQKDFEKNQKVVNGAKEKVEDMDQDAEVENFEKKIKKENYKEKQEDSELTEISKKKQKKVKNAELNGLDHKESPIKESDKVVTKKKRNKDKHRVEDDLENALSKSLVPNVQEDDNSENTNKTKKRKHKNSEAQSVEEEQPMEEFAQSIKKKNKHKDVTTEVVKSVIDVHEQPKEEALEKYIEKKKKHKYVTTDFGNSVTDGHEEKTNKRKHNKNEFPSTKEEQPTEEFAQSAKKKNKHKDMSTEAETSVIDVNEQPKEEALDKRIKKEKKHKDVTTDSENSVTDVHKEKTNKRKHNNNEFRSTEEEQPTEEFAQSVKKKNKHKDVTTEVVKSVIDVHEEPKEEDLEQYIKKKKKHKDCKKEAQVEDSVTVVHKEKTNKVKHKNTEARSIDEEQPTEALAQSNKKKKHKIETAETENSVTDIHREQTKKGKHKNSNTQSENDKLPMEELDVCNYILSIKERSIKLLQRKKKTLIDN